MRSPNRIHDRRFFYKYMSYETAKKVLINKSLRWSSPLIFNDPFDVPRQVLPDVTEKQIASEIAKMLIEELKNPTLNPEDTNDRIGFFIKFFRENFPDGVPETLLENMEELVISPPIGKDAGTSIKVLKDKWITMLSERRILCLSENPFITSMWNHYADGYKGVVLEFECIDEIDSAWLIASPIKYSDELPLTYTPEGMASLFFLKDAKALSYVVNEVTYMKTTEWATEKEWRISTFKRLHEDGLFSDYTFHPIELHSIIKGPFFDNANDLELEQLSQEFPTTSILNAKITEHRKIELE